MSLRDEAIRLLEERDEVVGSDLAEVIAREQSVNSLSARRMKAARVLRQLEEEGLAKSRLKRENGTRVRAWRKA